MINAESGSIEFKSCNCLLRPDTVLEEFLVTPAGRSAELVIENIPWVTYQFRLVDDDEYFHVNVVFNRTCIFEIRLSLHLDGDEGKDLSKSTELSRKRMHDALLLKELGRGPYRFHWGEIVSVFDPISISSEVIVRFARD